MWKNQCLGWCFVLGICIQGVQAQVDQPVDRILATLEDQIVLESDLERMFLGLQQEGKISTQDNAHARKCELLEFLITNQLMLAVAHRDSIHIPIELIDAELEGRLGTGVYGSWTEEDFLRAFGKTREDIKKEMHPVVEEQLLVQKIERDLVEGIRITPDEVKKHFEGIPAEQMPQLEAEVEVAQLLILPQKSTELKYQFGETPSLAQAESFLDSLRELILKDEFPFEEAARSYSNDAYTAPQGGYFLNPAGGQKLFMSELDAYLFFVVDTLEVGSLSPPLNYRNESGEEGWRMIYLKSKTPAHTATFAKDFDKLKIIALQAKRDRFVKDWFKKNINAFALDVDEDYEECVFVREK